MATEILSRSLLRGGLAILTPSLFRELDAMCRERAGRPLSMFRRNHRPLFGYCEYFASAVYRDIRFFRKTNDREFEGQWLFCEMGLLRLANEISIARWKSAERPEIDLSAIPEDRVHEYVALHEIGHVVENFCQGDLWKVMRKVDFGEEGRKIAADVGEANELLADRYAWRSMFPDEPMPVLRGRESAADWLAAFEVKAGEMGLCVKRITPKQPLPADPTVFTPKENVGGGLPWSRQLDRDEILALEWVQDLRQAKADHRNWRRRFDRRLVREERVV